MQNLRRYACSLATVALVGWTVGCGGYEGPRMAVSGAVTLESRPTDGEILFIPAPGTKGTPAKGVVKAGQYSVPAAAGPHEGDYNVTVRVGPPLDGESYRNARVVTKNELEGTKDKTKQVKAGIAQKIGELKENSARRTFRFRRTLSKDNASSLDFDCNKSNEETTS